MAYCPQCGRQADAAHAQCMFCGFVFASAQQPQQQPNYQQPSQQIPPAPLHSQQTPPPQPQNGSIRYMLKHLVLAQAPTALNRPDQPWAVTVQGDSIVASWKWMDATWFSPGEVSEETKAYTFTVTLEENGRWRELDTSNKKKFGVGLSGGKLSLGGSSSSFKGKTSQKSFSFGVGANNQTGQAGLVSYKFDTELIKKPVRDYLFSCGYRNWSVTPM